MGLSNIKKIAEGKKAENKSFEQQFEEDFNKAYLEIEEERQQETPTDYYRPSSLGGGCKRMLAFQRWGVEQDKADVNDEWTYNLIRITESGTDRHTRIQDVIFKMEQMGIELENLDVEEVIREAQLRGIKSEFIEWDSERKEARCSNKDINVYFKADGVFKYKGKEVLLEIKSANGFKFNKLVKLDTPHEDHIRQDTCYGMGLGIDYVLYIYEDNNFKKLWVKLYKITDEDKQFIIDKVKDTNYFVDNHIVPPMEKDKCMYCRYKQECTKWEEGQIYDVGNTNS